MDLTPVNNEATQSAGLSSVTTELYFLIARVLAEGPCKNASEALQRELEAHGLLPKRIDWHGNEHDQNFEEVCRRYSHIGSNHLLEICRRLGPLVDKEVPTNVRGVHSLLGAGRQSILRRKENVIRKLSRHQYDVRQNQRPRCYPLDLVHPPNSVSLLLSREFTGSMDQRNVMPAKLYGRVQQFCRTLGHLTAVYCVLFDRTGQYIFTGADDLLVKIWSAVTGRLLSTLRGASAEIADLAVSYDNTLLAAGSCDKIVRVWCLRTTAPIAVLTGHGGTITSINFCPADRGDRGNVRYLASTSSDGSVSFWEYITEPGSTPKFFPKPHKFNEKIRPGQAQMLCASFSPGGMFLATGCADHHVRVYAMFAPEGPERILELEAHGDRVDSIQWANSGLRFISGSKDGTALIWHYEKQEWRRTRLRMTSRLDGSTVQSVEDLGQKLRVTMVTWSRDDRWLITAVSDFSIKLWDSTNGNLHKELRGHEGEAFVLEPHPYDSNILLSAGHDGRLLIWDLAKGEVLKSFLNFIEGQGHGAVFDAKWSPSGSTIAATDSHGHLSIYGLGPCERFKKLPKAIFFHTDYRPLIRDTHHHVLDEQTQLAPHLMPPPFLVDSDGNPYPPALQKLVPGRENQKDEQLVPTIVYNASGEPEILAGVDIVIPPPAPVENGAAAIPQQPSPAAAMAPPSQLFTAHRTRSNIDQRIAELVQEQERHRHRPRSSSSASGAAAASSSSVTPGTDHSYTSRQGTIPPPSRPLIALSANVSPRALVSPMNQEDGSQERPTETPAPISTETTASESLPGYRRTVIVKPLTSGQLESNKAARQCWADEEVDLFYQEVQRKSPDLLLDTSVSPGVAALWAARSRGVSDVGWSPSRPSRRPNPPSNRPAQARRERPTANVSSPARSRMPPVSSPARRTNNAASASQSQPHNYRTRANRTTNSTRRTRESERPRERSRRVVRNVSSSDEGEEVDVESEEPSEQRQQRRSSRRTSPIREQDESGEGDSDEDEDVHRTRSHARRTQRPPAQRDGDALSTSDSNDSDSESELASDLLDSDDSDSEIGAASSESSSEYSDWTAEAGVNLEPPKRTRKTHRRPRCLSSEEETAAATAATSSTAAEGAEDGEASNASPPVTVKKRRPPIPKSGVDGFEGIPESFRPSEWLSEVVPRRSPFYPQMGDEVVYFRQGHELYVKMVAEKNVYENAPKSLPWTNRTIREQEFVKIIGIKYEIKPPRLCCLKLGLMDPVSGTLTSDSFTIKYHDIQGVLDFLVLRQTYDLAVERNWQEGDHFRCIIDDLWWEGKIEAKEPYDANHPDSLFLCYKIRWDNGETDQMSPWDLEPIDKERRPHPPGTGVTVLPGELASIMYRPRAEDWPPGGDRDAECDRIARGLSQAMSIAIAEPFAAPVDLNMYPSYAYVVEYPMDLSTIKARLENRFYRRVTAVQYDVRFIYTNACKFNQSGSDIVRSASIISDVCLEIIRNGDSMTEGGASTSTAAVDEAVDATSIYHRIVERYKAENQPGTSKAAVGKKNGGGPAAPTTPNTRSRSRRNSPNTESEESDNETKKSKGKSIASKDKRISTRMAAVATLSWKQQCRDLLNRLCQSDDATPFLEPVNPLDEPDYHTVVDHPMDLQTVREQLQVNNYHSPTDFAKDVRLIFENSKNYNTNKKSKIYTMTLRLAAVFEEHIRGILTSYKQRKNTSAESSKTKNHHSKDAKSRKGKALAPPSSHLTRSKDVKGKVKPVNGVEPPRENIRVVLSRSSRGQMAVQGSSSQPVDSARRRILGEDENSMDNVLSAGPSSSSSLPNGTSTTVPDTSSSYVDVKPGPSRHAASSSAGLAPVLNGTGSKRVAAQKRARILSEDEEDEEDEESKDGQTASGGPSDTEPVKGKALKKTASQPVVLKQEPQPTQEDASSDEDEIPISQRRRVSAARPPPLQEAVVKEELLARPCSSISNSSYGSTGADGRASGGLHSSHSSIISFGSDSLDPNGNPLRRSGRTRRKPKRPLDSESAGDEIDLDESSNHQNRRSLPSGKRPVRQTRNGGRRSTGRYREESEDEAAAAAASNRRSSRPQRHQPVVSNSEEESDEDENEDPRARNNKRQTNGRSGGGGLKRKSRQSAQEASKKIRSDFMSTSEEDEEDRVAVPTYSVSSRGRVRKLATQEIYD